MVTRNRSLKFSIVGVLTLAFASASAGAADGHWRLVSRKMTPSSEELAAASRPPEGQILKLEGDVGIEVSGGRVNVHTAASDPDNRLCEARTSFSFTADKDLQTLRAGDTVSFSGSVETSGNELAAATGAQAWARISIGNADYLLEARANIGAPVSASGSARIPSGSSADQLVIHFNNYLGSCQSLGVEMTARYDWVEGPARETRNSGNANSDFAGRWATSEGLVDLSGPGLHLTGTYPNDNGRLEAEMHGNVLSGFWAEDSSGQTCATERMGTRAWGRIAWTIAADGKSFNGTWSYCDADPVSNASGSWTGSR